VYNVLSIVTLFLGTYPLSVKISLQKPGQSKKKQQVIKILRNDKKFDTEDWSNRGEFLF